MSSARGLVSSSDHTGVCLRVVILSSLESKRLKLGWKGRVQPWREGAVIADVAVRLVGVPAWPVAYRGLPWFFTPVLGATASATRRWADEPKSRSMIVAPLWMTGRI